MTRRDLVKLSALAAGGLAVRGRWPTEPVVRAAAPLRILILGETNFIGPSQVRYAVERAWRAAKG